MSQHTLPTPTLTHPCPFLYTNLCFLLTNRYSLPAINLGFTVCKCNEKNALANTQQSTMANNCSGSIKLWHHQMCTATQSTEETRQNREKIGTLPLKWVICHLFYTRSWSAQTCRHSSSASMPSCPPNCPLWTPPSSPTTEARASHSSLPAMRILSSHSSLPAILATADISSSHSAGYLGNYQCFIVTLCLPS